MGIYLNKIDTNEILYRLEHLNEKVIYRVYQKNKYSDFDDLEYAILYKKLSDKIHKCNHTLVKIINGTYEYEIKV